MKDLFKTVKAIVKTIDGGKYSEIFENNIKLLDNLNDGTDVSEVFKDIEQQRDLLENFRSEKYEEYDRQLLISSTDRTFGEILSAMDVPLVYNTIKHENGNMVMITLSTRKPNQQYINEEKYNLLYLLKRLREQYIAICFDGYIKGDIKIENLDVVYKEIESDDTTIEVLLGGDGYPLLHDYMKVDVDKIDAYSINKHFIQVIDDENARIVNSSKNAYKLKDGFINEEEVHNWLKDQGVKVKLIPVCVLSFIYNSKEYSSIYVPDMDRYKTDTMNLNELVIGQETSGIIGRKQIRVNNIYPKVGKSFLNLLIKAGYTSKEAVESLVIANETTGFSGSNIESFTIKIPVNGNRLDSVMNDKIVICKDKVIESSLQSKSILYIDVKDKLKLIDEVNNWNLFEMSQYDIIKAISDLDYVKETKLDRVTLRTKDFVLKSEAYKPIKESPIIYWVTLSGYEVNCEFIKPYDDAVIDMMKMYHKINGGKN